MDGWPKPIELKMKDADPKVTDPLEWLAAAVKKKLKATKGTSIFKPMIVYKRAPNHPLISTPLRMLYWWLA